MKKTILLLSLIISFTISNAQTFSTKEDAIEWINDNINDKLDPSFFSNDASLYFWISNDFKIKMIRSFGDWGNIDNFYCDLDNIIAVQLRDVREVRIVLSKNELKLVSGSLKTGNTTEYFSALQVPFKSNEQAEIFLTIFKDLRFLETRQERIERKIRQAKSEAVAKKIVRQMMK